MFKPYKSTSKLLGPCGPCTFINLTGRKGSARLELELNKIGRFKPFEGTEYTGFLEWGKKYDLEVEVVTESKELNEKMFSFIFDIEKTPKSKQKSLKAKAKELFKKQNEKYAPQIKVTKNIKAKLDSLLKKRRKVAVCFAVFSVKYDKYFPHWVVAYKKEKGKYHFLDSSRSLQGYRILSPKQLKEAFQQSRTLGFTPALVIIK